MRTRLAMIAVAALLCASTARAQDASEKIPRFASFKNTETYMREGPSPDARVKWVYHHKGMPVEVLAQYNVWRRVRDWDGEIGWVHVAMLSSQRDALIVGTGHAKMREQEDYGAPVVADVQPGAIGVLKACGHLACKVTFGEFTGWVDRSRLFGVYVDETF